LSNRFGWRFVGQKSQTEGIKKLRQGNWGDWTGDFWKKSINSSSLSPNAK
jgi:hypothetical protein